MNDSFWHERWESDRIGFHQQEVSPYLKSHWRRLELGKNTGVLVPLCGKSHDMNWLWQQDHSVLGVELSPIAVRAFFEENDISAASGEEHPFSSLQNGGLKLLCGDFFALTPEHTQGISAVYDRASLIAFPPDFRVKYAQHLTSLIGQGSHLLLITIDYPQEEMKGPPFSVTEKEVQELFSEHFSVQILESKDVLQENGRFLSRGVSRLSENVFMLKRH